MTGPMSGVPVAQGAQQALMDQGAPREPKQEGSRFDAVLADKAQGAQASGAVHATREAQPAEPARAVEAVIQAEKPRLPLASQVVRDLEQGHMRLEKLIQAGASGERFSNAELLSLQASMYKYTLELDLTSKVIEKATSGFKDMMKTQV